MSEQERWEDRYRTGDKPWDTNQPSAELQRVLAEDNIPPGKAIDLGCGTGTNAVWLARQRFDVTGVDFSSLAIEQAQQRAAEAGAQARFLAADLLDPPDLGGPFDFLFDRGCYHVVRKIDVQRYLKTLRQITRPGTIALVLAGNAKEPSDPGPPVVTEDALRAELGTLFTFRRLREFRFDLTPGSPTRPLAWSCLLERTH